MWFLEAFSLSLSLSEIAFIKKQEIHFAWIFACYFHVLWWFLLAHVYVPSSTRKIKANNRENIIILWRRLILWNELIYWHCHFESVIHLSFWAEMIWQEKKCFHVHVVLLNEEVRCKSVQFIISTFREFVCFARVDGMWMCGNVCLRPFILSYGRWFDAVPAINWLKKKQCKWFDKGHYVVKNQI